MKTEEEVTSGSVKVKAKYGILTVYDQTLDLCDLVKDINDTCPIKAGTETQTIIENIPNLHIHVSHSASFYMNCRCHNYVYTQHKYHISCIAAACEDHIKLMLLNIQ